MVNVGVKIIFVTLFIATIIPASWYLYPASGMGSISLDAISGLSNIFLYNEILPFLSFELIRLENDLNVW